MIKNVLALFILFTGISINAKASHVAGGDLSYQWLKDSTYTITFKLYRDCGGSSESSNVTLCYKNTCSASQGGTRQLFKISTLPDGRANGSEVATGCAGYPTKCGSGSSTIPGYREWWYSDTLTLPSRCNSWIFSISIGNRNTSVNINTGSPSTVQFYIEATLNNLAAQGNSSPVFSVKPVPYVCINQPYTFNNGAVDPNSDSMYFDILQPKANVGATSCPPTVANVSFVSASPTLNITNNPFQTNNTFKIDTATGQMNFTPGATGPQTVTVRAREYRNGVLIGSVMRDVQVQVLVCSSVQPTINTIANTLTGGSIVNGRIEGCSGTPLYFCFNLNSADTGARLVASDNSNTATPASIMSYTGQKTDSIRGCFSWTATTIDTGLKVLTINAKDSTCKPPGIAISQSFVIPIYINTITDIIKDTTICLGSSTKLSAVGGSSFTWSVLPGGSPVSSLSCTLCKDPIVTPTVTTRYVVVSNNNSVCNKNRDTVTVTVVDMTGQRPTAGVNALICAGDTIKLSASTIAGLAYSWSGPGTFTSALQNPRILSAAATHNGYYKVRTLLSGCYSPYDSVLVTVNPKPATPVLSNNTPLCTGNTLALTASTITGASYEWTGPNSFSSTTQNPSITNAQLVNAGTYAVKVTLATGCISATATTAVIIRETPVITGSSYTNPTTCAGTNGTIILNGLIASTSYTVNYSKNAVPQAGILLPANATGTITLTGLSADIYTGVTVTFNGCTSAPVGPFTLSDPTPPFIDADASTPICEGDTLKLSVVSGIGAIFSWTGPATFSSTAQYPVILNALSSNSGLYTVFATVSNCRSFDTIRVLVKPKPVLTIGSNAPLCVGSTLNLIGSTVPSGSTYNWSGPNSFTSLSQNPSVTNVGTSASGIYTAVATLNGCISVPATTNVNVYPIPVIGGTSFTDPDHCQGTNGSITLTGLLANTAYTVNYFKNAIAQPPATLTSNASGNVTMNGSASVYSNITVTLNGCTSPAVGPVTLTDPALPVITASNNGPICAGDTLKLFTTALVSGAVYGWSGPGGAVFGVQNPYIANAQVSHSGVYSVAAVVNNCVSQVVTTTVVVKPTPVLTAGSNSPLCAGNTLSLTATPYVGATYSWDGPNAYVSGAQNPIIINASTALSGSYTVIAGLNGCISKPSSVTVTVNPIPAAPTVSSTPLVYCQNTSTSPLTAIGANLLWYTTATGGTGSSVTPTPSTAAAGTFNWYVSQTVNGCEGPRAAITISILPQPAMPAIPASVVYYCQNEPTTQLTASGTDLKWYTVVTGGIPSATAPTPSSAISGTYNWYVTQTSGGCESFRASIVVVVHPKPALPVVKDVFYCEGDIPLSLTATGLDLKWYAALTGGTGTAVAPVPATTPVGVTHYFVSQTVNGCEGDRADITVRVDPAVKADIFITKDTICAYDTIEVYNTITTNPSTANYNWDFDDGRVFDSTNKRYRLFWNTPGLKYIKLDVSNLDCRNAASRSVFIKPAPRAYFQLSDHACLNQVLDLRPDWDYNNKYSWQLDNPSFADTTALNHIYHVAWDKPGIKTVIMTVKGANDCFIAAKADVNVHDDPEAHITSLSKNDICTNDTVTLSASYTNGYTYNWIPEKYFAGRSGTEVTAIVPATGFVSVQVTDEWNCVNSDSIFINTFPCCDVYLPDAFSPNADGKNDRFSIITTGHHFISKFIIVNRWGQTIFETNNEREGWDGTFKGNPQDVGTYFYYIKYKCSDNRFIEKKGEVTIVR